MLNLVHGTSLYCSCAGCTAFQRSRRGHAAPVAKPTFYVARTPRSRITQTPKQCAAKFTAKFSGGPLEGIDLAGIILPTHTFTMRGQKGHYNFKHQWVPA